MESNYWTKLTVGRLTRRRALAVTGASALGAAFLAACGGNDSDESTAEDTSGLLTKPTDTRKQAKRGGVLKGVTGEISGFEPSIQASSGGVNGQTFETLVTLATAAFDKEPTIEVEPMLAQSWEYSPDRLQITLKLQPSAKWHNKPPVSGRAFTSEDVLFSLDRAQAKSDNRAEYFNSLSPVAPFVSWSAPDARTVTLKIKEPVYYALPILGAQLGGNVQMVPKETDTTFDIRRDAIGTGPYVMKDYQPSLSITYELFSDYYDKNYGFLDRIENTVVPEYASGLAQFKAGNIHTFGVQPQDILTIKRETPELALYPAQIGTPIQGFSFGWLPEGKSPFLDERMRQAVSYSMDRDLWLEVVYNNTTFTSQGLPVDSRWSSHVWADRVGWLDPKSKDFGPNAKYFQHDVAEAKKLLAAAGHPNGIDVTNHISPNYGATYVKNIEILSGMFTEAGIRTVTKNHDQVSDFIPNYKNTNGKFDGWAAQPAPGNVLDATIRMRANYHSKSGGSFAGFSVSGKTDGLGDPTADAMIEKALFEFDPDKRTALSNDTQRYLAPKMYNVHWPGIASGFALAWPAVKNFGAFRGVPVYSRGWLRNLYYWLDESLPPFKKT